MSTLCLLFCDGLQARVYRAVCPPTELMLSYQQVNFGGSMPEFVISLCRTIRTDFSAGKFDDLVVAGPSAVLDVFGRHIDERCHVNLRAMVARDSGPPPAKKDLLAIACEALASDPAGANMGPA